MSDISKSKILIRTPNWLGDLVIATGFINAVLDNFPNSEVDLIIKSGLESLPIKHRGKIIIFDPEICSSGSFGKKLSKENYDTFYVLPPSFSSAWMAFKSKIPNRIGYAGQFRSILLSNAKKNENQSRTEHILKEYINLISPKISFEKYPPILKISKEWIDIKLNSFKYQLPKSFFALSPGASYGPAKQWPINYYRKLAKKINKFFNCKILILGTLKDFAQAEEISSGLDSVNNLCGKTSPEQLLAILSKAILLVSNDSGSMHLMGALQKPQIAIFGSTSPKWTSPINPYSIVINKDIKCSPCFERTCKYKHYECMTKITPELVFSKIQNSLCK